MYYGLSKESIIKFKEYENITDSDKEKRERLIQIKKDNYYKNPNFHVSETRLSFRNIDKNITEKNLKNKIYDLLNNDDKISKEYKNIKLIKQIKLLKEDDDKSKCFAFVECVNFNIAKFIIDNLSGIVLNQNSKKGLIIDFCLDDFRKKLSREKKLERLKEIKKQRKIEEKEKRKIENKAKNKNENKNEKKSEIKDCNDINKLIDLYHTTLSRGKKQRIKKKLKNLGYNKDIPPAVIKKEKTIDINEKNDMDNNDDYVQIKISNNKTELNKKMKNKIKEKKKEGDNLIGKKRNRDIKRNTDFKGFGDDEEKNRKKRAKKERKALITSKKVIQEKIDSLKNNNDMDNDDNDLDMKEYYSKIMKKLNKKD